MSATADSMLQKFGANIARTVVPRPADSASPAPAAPQADRYAGAVKSRAFGELPVDALTVGEQPRTEFDQAELERLADSIKRFGQLAPVRVRFDAGQGSWVVLVGERRLRACRLAGLERVRVEFVEREMTEADVLAEQVVENAVRADLQPVEAGRAYKRLMDLNDWTAQQLAETIGVEPTSVYRALALLKLPEDVAARVDAGEIKATAAYELSKLQTADAQRVVADKVVREGLDHKSTAAEVRRRKTSKPSSRPARPPAEQKFRGPRGVRVTVQTKPKHTPADIAADLRALADQIEAGAEESDSAEAA
ncbi:MAG: ParB/RepB/Spo0J family partition protein [Isosphaeraceae bacterium]